MSNKKKGVDLINSRTPAQAKEHRREVLDSVHEAKVKGFSHGETVDALRQKFQVTRDMARQYIVWYNDDKKGKRYVDFDLKRQLLWDRLEDIYGKTREIADTTGDYKQSIEVTDKMTRFLEREEKHLATLNPEAPVAPIRVAWGDKTPAQRELLLKLAELHLDALNTHATDISPPTQIIQIPSSPAAE